MSDTPTSTQHPAELAINLQRECVRMKLQRESLRSQASALRKQAKATKVKADAFAMRTKAKPMSDEAQALRVKLGKAGTQLLAHVEEAHALLTKRMPEGWCQWGVVKTRAYAACLDIVATQLQRVHPAPAVVVTALQHALGHESWNDSLMAKLAVAKANTKEIPLN